MLRSFQLCLVCKCPTFDNSLCRFCWTELLRRQKPVTRSESGHYVRSLFRWEMDDHGKALSWMIRSLKDRRDVNLWMRLAELFLCHYSVPAGATLIAVPGNHSGAFAQALYRLTGLKIQTDVLLKSSTVLGQQKGLSRTRRQEVCFDLSPTCRKFTNVVIVDDVVTTGATARAAYKALGRPRQCEVWCLLDRRPCGGSW